MIGPGGLEILIKGYEAQKNMTRPTGLQLARAEVLRNYYKKIERCRRWRTTEVRQRDWMTRTAEHLRYVVIFLLILLPISPSVICVLFSPRPCTVTSSISAICFFLFHCRFPPPSSVIRFGFYSF
ncbi:unnamed protein product [Vicia faba]|uniref:Uncharacterized protein n=1 Tax=Vicia faba TaxID=3906 RepID=A0AAV0Z1I3_VICFA|nr:unnamed protein product [Vicia faba]